MSGRATRDVARGIHQLDLGFVNVLLVEDVEEGFRSLRRLAGLEFETACSRTGAR